MLRHVFHEDCMFPDTLRKAFMMLLEVHGLADWEPAAAGALTLDPAKLEEIFAEKDAALAGVTALAGKLDWAAAQLEEPGRTQLRDTAGLWTLYVKGFRACARACFSAQYHLQQGDDASLRTARAELKGLDAYRAKLETALEGTRFAYLVYWMLDTKRLAKLSQDLAHKITPVAEDAPVDIP